MPEVRCDYDVTGLPSGTCPECGRPTSAHEADETFYGRVVLFYVAVTWLGVLTLALAAIRLVARVELGRPPLNSYEAFEATRVVSALGGVFIALLAATPFVMVFAGMTLGMTWGTRLGVRLVCAAGASLLLVALLEGLTHCWELYFER